DLVGCRAALSLARGAGPGCRRTPRGPPARIGLEAGVDDQIPPISVEGRDELGAAIEVDSAASVVSLRDGAMDVLSGAVHVGPGMRSACCGVGGGAGWVAKTPVEAGVVIEDLLLVAVGPGQVMRLGKPARQRRCTARGCRSTDRRRLGIVD